MQSNERKKMIQQGFDTVAAGYDHPSLSFFPDTAKRLVEHLNLNSTDNLLDVCTGTGICCHRRKAVVPTFFTFHCPFVVGCCLECWVACIAKSDA